MPWNFDFRFCVFINILHLDSTLVAVSLWGAGLPSFEEAVGCSSVGFEGCCQRGSALRSDGLHAEVTVEFP